MMKKMHFRSIVLLRIIALVKIGSFSAQRVYDPYPPQRLPFAKLGLVKQYANSVALTADRLLTMSVQLRGGGPIKFASHGILKFSPCHFKHT